MKRNGGRTQPCGAPVFVMMKEYVVEPTQGKGVGEIPVGLKVLQEGVKKAYSSVDCLPPGLVGELVGAQLWFDGWMDDVVMSSSFSRHFMKINVSATGM